MQREQSKCLLELRMSNPGPVFFGGGDYGSGRSGKDRQTKEKLLGGGPRGPRPLICTSVATFKFPTVREWLARVSGEIPVTMAEPQSDHCRGNTFLSIQGCIHGQELRRRTQRDTANFREFAYRVHSVPLLRLYNPNLSTAWTSAGFRLWPHLVQKTANIPANAVWIYRPIIHR